MTANQCLQKAEEAMDKAERSVGVNSAIAQLWVGIAKGYIKLGIAKARVGGSLAK